MSTCEHDLAPADLELPVEFEELGGPLGADLQAIVQMLAQRAHERLILTRREYGQLETSLWNGMVGALNEALSPLTAECR